MGHLVVAHILGSHSALGVRSHGPPVRCSALAQRHLHSLPSCSGVANLQDGGAARRSGGAGVVGKERNLVFLKSFSCLREALSYRWVSCFSFSLLPLPVKSQNNFHELLALPSARLPPLSSPDSFTLQPVPQSVLDLIHVHIALEFLNLS